MDAEGICFECVEQALHIADSEVRLFGKPVAYEKRRMGVALARANSTDQARQVAAEVASKVIPQKP